MSLETFWEGIKFSDFLEDKFESVREALTDFADDIKEIIEQGEELVTDGFSEILFKGRIDYQSSVEQREQANGWIYDEEKRCRAARGIDEKTMPLFLFLKDELNSMADKLEESKSPFLENLRRTLAGQFNLIYFDAADELRKLREKVSVVYSLPDSPEYKAPLRDEEINFLGSFPMKISYKEARKRATEKYVKEVEEYLKMLRELTEDSGKNDPCFKIDALPGDTLEIVTAFCERYNLIWGPTTYGRSDTLSESEAAEMETSRLKLLLIFAAGIYTAGKYALSDTYGDDNIRNHSLIDEFIRLEGRASLLMVDFKEEVEGGDLDDTNMDRV